MLDAKTIEIVQSKAPVLKKHSKPNRKDVL